MKRRTRLQGHRAAVAFDGVPFKFVGFLPRPTYRRSCLKVMRGDSDPSPESVPVHIVQMEVAQVRKTIRDVRDAAQHAADVRA